MAVPPDHSPHRRHTRDLTKTMINPALQDSGNGHKHARKQDTKTRAQTLSRTCISSSSRTCCSSRTCFVSSSILLFSAASFCSAIHTLSEFWRVEGCHVFLNKKARDMVTPRRKGWRAELRCDTSDGRPRRNRGGGTLVTERFCSASRVTATYSRPNAVQSSKETAGAVRLLFAQDRTTEGIGRETEGERLMVLRISYRPATT